MKNSKHQITINPLNLINEKNWSSWEDIEDEIERIREEFDLLDSRSRYDEAWSKFEDIYHVNPIDVLKHL